MLHISTINYRFRISWDSEELKAIVAPTKYAIPYLSIAKTIPIIHFFWLASLGFWFVLFLTYYSVDCQTKSLRKTSDFPGYTSNPFFTSLSFKFWWLHWSSEPIKEVIEIYQKIVEWQHKFTSWRVHCVWWN